MVTCPPSNARDLHGFLENGDKFTTWIKDRIRLYEFTQGVDYEVFSGSAEKGRGSHEYALSLDMAKELAMVERNAKGREARRYFIDCEKRLQRGERNVHPFFRLLPKMGEQKME